LSKYPVRDVHRFFFKAEPSVCLDCHFTNRHPKSVHALSGTGHDAALERETAMNRKARIGTSRNMLQRIAALLFALADLADRAALAPGSVRRVVLWALCHADAVAREYVSDAAWEAGWQWSPAVGSVRYGFEPVDAANLASSLRMLAVAVQTIAAVFMPPACAGTASAAAGRSSAAYRSLARLTAGLSRAIASPPASCDTS
jgi:hypothetical protein